jgi:hypothetical protein
VLKRAAALCAKVCANWESPFDVGGTQAIFHVQMAADDEEGGLNEGLA